MKRQEEIMKQPDNNSVGIPDKIAGKRDMYTPFPESVA